MAKQRGRPAVPYRPSWGGPAIHGLYRHADGRWRIVATGEKFTEHDEHQAIDRFRRWEREQESKKEPFVLPLAQVEMGDTEAFAATVEKLRGPRIDGGAGADSFEALFGRRQVSTGEPTYLQSDGRKYTFARAVDELAFWAKVKWFLTHDPLYMAKMTSYPALINILRMGPPQDTIVLQDIEAPAIRTRTC